MMITLEKIINLVEISISKLYIRQVKIGCWNKSRAKLTQISGSALSIHYIAFMGTLNCHFLSS